MSSPNPMGMSGRNPAERNNIFSFLNEIWQQWNVQAIVLASLAFQVVLIFAAPTRTRAKGNLRILTLWSVYLLADYIATYAIGLINNGSQIRTTGNEAAAASCGAFKRLDLAPLWAPFLLLHLGGPDTITAFAIEDNELWHRHLLSLIVQLLSVLLVFYRYRIHKNRFLIPTGLTFIAGVIKYAERTRSLNRASLPNLKKSMREDPDAGPDYAQLMEEMASKQAANLPVKIDINREKGAKADTGEDGGIIQLEEVEVIRHGYKFFKTFKGLIVDHMFSFLERDESRTFYTSLKFKDAFRVMEMELNFIYDAMFTKMSAVRSVSGYIFRFICTALLISATVTFSLSLKKHHDHPIHMGDKIVTYFLLGGGVALDLIAIMELIFSKWTIASLLVGSEKSLTTSTSAPNWRKKLAKAIQKMKGIIPTKRWSEEMHQYSFINHCLHKWPNWVSYLIDQVGLIEAVCSCLYGKTRDVEEKLKELIFNEIKRKGKQATKTSVAKEISSSKGEWTLLDYNCGPEIHFSVSQDVEYDECVLMWHIATEIFYFSSSRAKSSSDEVHDADICRYISEYLLYLLVMERKMTSAVAGIVEIRFRDTCEEATNFFKRQQKQKTCHSLLETFKKLKKACGLYLYSMMLSTWDDIKYAFTFKCFTEKGRKRKPTLWEEHQNTEEDEKRKGACEWLKSVNPQVKPSEVKGDRSKSLLFDACILAGHLERLCDKNTPYTENEVWGMMSKVWVELLSYGACNCRGDAHAQYLGKGGELLTFVWLLMAHFGLGEQFRIEAGHARAKLIVGKEDIN
ncbi:PREDICTED: uncharacterized protein LOC109187834 [Ipomoea nil]|uniref:uncharacterized protein LOC109187834 n=1 Tax=Ipomoea nil TaxID=35883 RepID=UPI0009013144|nr:PREDICTED: uncharacterized protein LOC109187834 [Ipomoea nil]XP_019193731.1 PREDICTED: uncharacterized protein LOC109187834 [Ipomoea nil]